MHVIQLEIAGRLYLAERRVKRLPVLATLRADMDRLVASLVASDWDFLRG